MCAENDTRPRQVWGGMRVQEVVSFGGGRIIVWGGICRQERTPMVIVNGNSTAQRFIADTLRPTVLPFLQQQPRGVIYQYDNVILHTARIVQHFLEPINVNVNVNVLPWPACLPDMSWIEHTPTSFHGSSCSTISTLQPTNKN